MKEDIIRMARDAGDTIRMARDAGMCVGTNLSGVVLVGSPAEIGLAHLTIEELERFAALVADRMIQNGYRKCAEGQKETQFCGQLESAVAGEVAAEREACAKVCEEHWRNSGNAMNCADAIRARGQDPMPLFDDWDGGFPYKQKAWNGLTESQVMEFCKEARQVGVHSLLWKVNNLLKQQNT